jgi:DNA-binding transcriptional MerR regulator
VDKAPEAFRIISEVATELNVPQHVLRFWESRFSQIRPMKRGGGRRYYRPEDVDLLRGIRHLLYSEGYTIRGAQRILREQGVQFVQAVWKEGAPQPPRGLRRESDAEEAAGGGGLGFRDLLAAFRGPRPGDDAAIRQAAADEGAELDEAEEETDEESDDVEVADDADEVDEDFEEDEGEVDEADADEGGDESKEGDEDDDDEDDESEEEEDMPAASVAALQVLANAELAVLRSALDELDECRRLLDTALEDAPR